MKWLAASFLFLVLIACASNTPPEAASPKKEDVCGHGRDAHVCPSGYWCGKDTPPLRDADAGQPPNGPSYEGGGCGGVAGFHCADGLVCEMPPDQETVADGMGTCVVDSRCLKAVQGCFGMAGPCTSGAK